MQVVRDQGYMHLQPFQPNHLLTVAASVVADSEQLTINCLLKTAQKSRIFLPDPVLDPAFCLDLWKSTCFSCFVSPVGNAAYLEWNIAPNKNWAVFSFHSYRKKTEINAKTVETLQPEIKVDTVETPAFELSIDVMLPLKEIKSIWPSSLGKFDVAVCATVDERSWQSFLGKKNLSYWAMAHGAKPDFHTRTNFLTTVQT